MSAQHDWKETGVERKHVEGNIFKYGTPVVIYVRCSVCQQNGYRRPNSPVVFTWRAA